MINYEQFRQQREFNQQHIRPYPFTASGVQSTIYGECVLKLAI